MNDEFLTNSNACLIIGCPLSMSHQSDIEIIFRHFDLNKDKYLDFDEFAASADAFIAKRVAEVVDAVDEKRRGSMMGREMDDWAAASGDLSELQW